jgi:hypothetical protein
MAKRHALYKVELPTGKKVNCTCLDIAPSGVVDLNPAALLALGFNADDDIEIEGATVTALAFAPE